MSPNTRTFRHPKNRSAGGIVFLPGFAAVILTLLGLGFGVLVAAQDLGDNDVCMACHVAFEWSAPENSDRPRVHNDDGTFIQQVHEMWSCTNCHEDVTEIPHRADVERGVNCLNCHEAVPKE